MAEKGMSLRKQALDPYNITKQLLSLHPFQTKVVTYVKYFTAYLQRNYLVKTHEA